MNRSKFLEVIFDETDGYLDITGIHATTKQCHTRCYVPNESPDWDRIDAANAAGWGIYYGVATKRVRREGKQRGKESTALWLPVIWAEIDLKDGYYSDLDAIQDAIGKIPQPATVITASGGGIHALWRITPIKVTPDNIHTIKQVIKGMAVYLHGDTSVSDLARVLRMPGTINTKPERNGAKCTILSAIDGEFTFDQFLDYREYAPNERRAITREIPSLPSDDNTPGCVDWYATNGGVNLERNTRLNWAAHKLHSDGHDIGKAHSWLMPYALSFGLGEREIIATIRSAYQGSQGVPSYVSTRTQSRMRAGDALKGIVKDK